MSSSPIRPHRDEESQRMLPPSAFSQRPFSFGAERRDSSRRLGQSSSFSSRLFRRLSRRWNRRGALHERQRGEDAARVTSVPESSPTAHVGDTSLDREDYARGHTMPFRATAPLPMRATSLPPSLSAAQSSTWPLEGRRDGMTEFFMQLNSLKDGLLFAGRYRLESARIQGKPHCRFAVERRTGRRVFLKFFPRDSPKFNNAVRFYSTTEVNNKYFNRMLESIESIYGFPPCLVLERGDYSLADRKARHQMSAIEQRALLFSVLEALDALHSKGMVHGNLSPSHLMWFATESMWKLVDVEYAASEGQTAMQGESSTYTPPEFMEADMHSETAAHLVPSADMWSFGVIAFEVLTCSSVTDPIGIQEYIDGRLQISHPHPERTLSRSWLSSNPRGRVEDDSEEQILRFVQSMLRRDPTERQTAADALSDVLFRSATDFYQRFDRQQEEDAFVSAREMQETLSVPDWLLTVGLADRLQIAVAVEYLPNDDADANLPFHRQTGEQAWMFDDDYLPSLPVHFIKLGKTYRLNIQITPESDSGIAVDRIVSVTANPPDADSSDLIVEQRRRNGAVMAMALLRPSQLGSRQLRTKSPHFGAVEEKYVRLDVGIRCMLREPMSREMVFRQTIYCKLVRPNRKLWLHRYVGMIKNENVPCPPLESHD